MAIENEQRLKAAGPIDPANKFPRWFEDRTGRRLELVTRPDPRAPAMGDIEHPAADVVFPGNFPEEAFYFMAEARLEVGGMGTVGRARIILALEAGFVGDGSPKDGLGVVFARIRVRIDDVVPGATYIVRHPYGTLDDLEADENGRVFHTCDLGIAEGKMNRVLVTGQVAPFLEAVSGAPGGYIGDGITEVRVKKGRFRNHVEIEGDGIGQGSVNGVGPNLVTTDLFTVQGRIAGTGPGAGVPPLGPEVPALSILGAEFRTSRRQYRVRGEINPVTRPAPGGTESDRVDVWIGGQLIGSAFPDLAGAWTMKKTKPGAGPPIPGALTTVQVTTASNKHAQRILLVRN